MTDTRPVSQRTVEARVDRPSAHSRPHPPRRWVPYAVGGGIYLVLSIAVWWHLWSHPTSTTTCGCGDAALTLWVLNWPAYALAHGHNPFFSTALFYPSGINMAPNSLALGTVFAPVTWLFGPVATENVITTLAPPLSALSMFWLLRRWVTWTPAAFLGGLFYGFSPFVLVSLALAHPNFGLLVFPPLIVGCLDELIIRQRRRPTTVGIALGVLIVMEFFVAVEVLLMMLLFFVFAVVLLLLWNLCTTRDWHPVERARHAVRGLATAAVVAAVLLAYPLWFYFAGPAHLSGRAWPNSPAGTVGSTPRGFVNGFLSQPLTQFMHLFGGYQGPTLPLLSYVGIGVLIVLAAGMVIWRHDRLLWFFGILGVVAAVLSLGVGNGYWGPWRLFVHLPVLNSVVPINLTAITDLCVAVMLAVIIGHAYTATRTRLEARTETQPGTRVSSETRPRLPHGIAALVGIAIGALAIVPVAVALWPNVPMTARPVVLPRWFATASKRLPPGKVVLPYPAAFGGIQSSMAWQAVGGMPFSMVGGGGPGVVPARAGSERPGFDVLERASVPLDPPPNPTTANVRAIRDALAGWRVTTIVVPDQPRLPTYDKGRTVAYAVGLFTAVLGRQPTYQDSAWVWNDVRSPGPPITISSAAFAACTDPGVSPAQSVSCVLSAG